MKKRVLIALSLMTMGVFSLACGGVDALLGSNAPLPAVDTSLPGTPSALFPVGEGLALDYRVTERRGAGMRLFGIPTKPATTSEVGTWRFEVTGRDDATDPPTYTATFKTTASPGVDASLIRGGTEEFRLRVDEGMVWVDTGTGEKPGVIADLPSRVVPTDRFPCTLNVIGGIKGMCAVPGLPGGSLPGPTDHQLSREADNGRTAAQWIVGIATVGMLIPGNQTAKWTVIRTGGTLPANVPAPLPLWTAWEDSTKLGNGARVLRGLLRKHAPDPVSLAAIVQHRNDATVMARAEVALAALPPELRPPVVRSAYRSIDNHASTVRFHAVNLDLLRETPEADKPFMRGVMSGWAFARVMNLEAGTCPGLLAMWQQTDVTAMEELAEVADAFETHAFADLGSEACLEEVLETAAGLGEDRYSAVMLRMADTRPPATRAMWVCERSARIGRTDPKFQALQPHYEAIRALPEDQRRACVNAAFPSELDDDERATLSGILGIPPVVPSAP